VTGIIEKIEKDKITVKFDENKSGFIKKNNLAKAKAEQNTERFAVKEKIDAKVIKKSSKDNLYELSVKDLEIQEEKDALKEYGSSSSGASIGDIIGAALDKNKETEKKQNKNNDEE
jgi:small subunit ribosomal protein S1